MSSFDVLQKNFETLKQKTPAGVQTELYATESESLNIAHFEGKLDKYAFSSAKAASLRVIVGSSEGYASTEDFSTDAIHQAFNQALANARLLAETQKAGDEFRLGEPSLASAAATPTSRLASLSPEEKIRLSFQLEAAARATDPRVKAVPYTGYSENLDRRHVFNSHGVALSDEISFCTLNCFPLVEQDRLSKMSYGPSLFARDPRDLEPNAFAEKNARRALARLAPGEVRSGRYLCVFSSLALENFFEPLGSMVAGSGIFENTSAFSTKLGQSVASSNLSVFSDPLYAGSLRHMAFDCEGSASHKVAVIQNGVFNQPLTNARWAKKLGCPNTASAARATAHSAVDIDFSNLVIGAGSHSPAKLLKSAPKILFIDEIEGLAGFNRTTGNFSLPVMGFEVENGLIKRSVDNFLVSGNIFEFLSKIQAIGNDVQSARGEIFTPSMLISDVSIAGK